MTNLLKEKKMKATKARETILRSLSESNTPLTAEELYKKVLKYYTVNLSTIYRTLTRLTENNVLLKQLDTNAVAHYQLNQQGHSHFLICVNCNKKINIHLCPAEELIENVARKTNFKILNHSVELYGLCEKCKSPN